MGEVKKEYLNDVQGWTKKIITEQTPYMIYRDDQEEVAKFLRQLEKDNPIVPDAFRPAGVYLDDFGIVKPKKEPQFSSDSMVVLGNILDFDYIQCAILKRVCEKTQELDDNNVSQTVIECISETKSIFPEAKTIEDYIAGMRKLLPRIATEYSALANGAERVEDVELFRFSIFNLNFILEGIMRKGLNNNGHISLILDKKEQLSTTSMRHVNDLMASGIPIKLILEPELDAWDTHHSDGSILSGYDYEVTALDAKGKELLRKKYGITEVF